VTTSVVHRTIASPAIQFYLQLPGPLEEG